MLEYQISRFDIQYLFLELDVNYNHKSCEKQYLVYMCIFIFLNVHAFSIISMHVKIGGICIFISFLVCVMFHQ